MIVFFFYIDLGQITAKSYHRALFMSIPISKKRKVQCFLLSKFRKFEDFCLRCPCDELENSILTCFSAGQKTWILMSVPVNDFTV